MAEGFALTVPPDRAEEAKSLVSGTLAQGGSEADVAGKLKRMGATPAPSPSPETQPEQAGPPAPNDARDRLRAMIRDPDFEKLKGPQQFDTVRGFLAGEGEPSFMSKGRKAKRQQDDVIASLINEHRKGFVEKLGDAALNVGKKALQLNPLYQAAVGAAEGYVSTDPSQLPTHTRALVGALAGFSDPANIGPGAAEKFEKLGDGILNTRLKRAVANSLIPLGEAYGTFAAGEALAAPLLDKIGKAVPALEEALSSGTPESIAAATEKATRVALVNQVKRAAVTGASVGVVQDALDAVEQRKIDPLPMAANVLGMAALGAALVPAERLVNRFGFSKARVQEATKAIESNPEWKQEVAGAQDFTKRLSKASGMSQAEAGEFAFAAARGDFAGTDTPLGKRLREAFVKDPELLTTPFGLRVARMNRDLFEPTFQKVEHVGADAPTEVTVEDTANRRQQTLSIRGIKERRELEQRLKDGEVRLLSASGHEANLNPLRDALGERPAPLPRVTGAEPSPDVPTEPGFGLARPGAEAPASLSAPLADAQTQGAVSPELWSQLKEWDAPTTAPELAIATGEREVPSGLPFKKRPRLAAEGLAPEGEARPPVLKKGQKVRSELVTDRQGRMITHDSEVIANDDPLGTTITLPNGAPASRDRATGRVSSTLTASAERAPGTQEARTAASDLKTGKGILTENTAGTPVTITPDTASGTAVVTNQTTGHATRTTLNNAMNRLLDGHIPAGSELTKISEGELVVSTERLARAAERLPEGGKPLNDALLSHYLEFQRRTGSLGTPLEETREEISSYFDFLIEKLGSERGSVEVGGKRPPPSRWSPLPEDDVLSQSARVAGARAHSAPDGRIVVEYEGGGKRFYEDRQTALRDLLETGRQRAKGAKLAARVETGERANRIDTAASPIPGEFLDPYLRVMRQTAPIGKVERYTTGTHNPFMDEIVGTVRQWLGRWGTGGRTLLHAVESKTTFEDLTNTRDLLVVERALKDLTPDEVAFSLKEAIEDGKPTRPQVRQAYNAIMTVLDRQHSDLGNVGGKPAAKIPNYFPHIHDEAALQNTKAFDNRARGLVRSGAAKTVEEAHAQLERAGFGSSRDRIAQRLVREKGWDRATAEAYIDKHTRARSAGRRASHLEFERDGLPGYVTDAKRAFVATITQNNKRIAEARFFGLKDETANEAIEQVGREYGDRARDYARTAFKVTTGDVERLGDYERAFLDWQNNRLALSVFAKSSEAVNAQLLTNTRSFGIGLRQAFTAEGREFATQIGALTSDIRRELAQGSWEDVLKGSPAFSTPLGQRVLKTMEATERISTGPFNLVASYFDRSISASAGRAYFRELLGKLRTDPKDANTIQRLRESFKITPDDVAKATKPEDAQALEFLASKRFVDAAQPKAGTTSMPLFWSKSRWGKFLFQFRGYAFGQSGIVYRELRRMFKPESAGDFRRGLRAFGIIAATFPTIGYSIMRARQPFTGKTAAMKETDEALDTVGHLVAEGRTPAWQEVRKLVAGYGAALGYASALGYTQDIALESLSGNQFMLDRLSVPPAASSLESALVIGGSLATAPFAQDHEHMMMKLHAARRSVGREIPALGGALELTGQALKTQGIDPGLLSARARR